MDVKVNDITSSDYTKAVDNGDFNVKHYQGKFNAYQRTYVLIPKEEKYFGSIYFATEKLVKKYNICIEIFKKTSIVMR